MFTAFVIILAILLAMGIIALALRNDTLKTTLEETEGHLVNEKLTSQGLRDEVSRYSEALRVEREKVKELEDTARRQSDAIVASTDLIDGLLKIESIPMTPVEGSPIYGVGGDGTFTFIETATTTSTAKPAVKKKAKPKAKPKQEPKAKPKAKPKKK